MVQLEPPDPSAAVRAPLETTPRTGPALTGAAGNSIASVPESLPNESAAFLQRISTNWQNSDDRCGADSASGSH